MNKEILKVKIEAYNRLVEEMQKMQPDFIKMVQSLVGKKIFTVKGDLSAKTREAIAAFRKKWEKYNIYMTIRANEYYFGLSLSTAYQVPHVSSGDVNLSYFVSTSVGSKGILNKIVDIPAFSVEKVDTEEIFNKIALIEEKEKEIKEIKRSLPPEFLDRF